MGWRGSVPTIRMPFQRFASDLPAICNRKVDGLSRLRQHRHSARRRPGDGRHPVEPACAAAVFLLVHTQGLRLRPRVGATLEAESGTNDPFAIFLTLMLVEYISLGSSSPGHVLMEFVQEAVLGAIVGVIGGRLVVLALN